MQELPIDSLVKNTLDNVEVSLDIENMLLLQAKVANGRKWLNLLI
jgi:hypothetical protein